MLSRRLVVVPEEIVSGRKVEVLDAQARGRIGHANLFAARRERANEFPRVDAPARRDEGKKMISQTSRPPFSAALLAGGQSSRMGTDKAAIEVDGQPLWQRQLDKLRAAGAAEVFISGRRAGPYAGSDCEIVEDRVADAGPLAGLEAALRHATHDWLLVLAVDLPDVPASLLASLVAEAIAADCGRVPAREDWLQPIAAVYPRRCLPLVEECLAGENRSLRRFFRLARKAGLADVHPLSAEEHALFRNLNSPADLATPTA
jgi:molybdopterin-guanine dinucleotide biosynthesis protein A